jgi:hypothetical protein
MLTIVAILLFTFLSILFCRKIISQQGAALSTLELTGAFCFKVIMGALYGYVFLHYYGGDDTWLLNRESMVEYNKLITSPLTFISDFNPVPAFERNDGFRQGLHYYLVDLEFWMITKPLALFNLLSRGDYYINSVFFNFIVFWGHYWLYRLLVTEFPNKRKPLLLIIFFFPPVVFWLSGIRADGLLLFFIALLFVQFNRWITTKNKRGLVWSVVALLFMLVLRNAVAILLVPALAAWWLVAKNGRKPLLTFTLVYLTSIVLFFSTLWISPAANLPSMIVKRQQEYLALHGNTRFELDTLQATPASFIRVLPQSLNNTFLRPYIWEAKGPLQLVTALEVIFFWLLILWFFFRKQMGWKQALTSPLILSFIYFSIFSYVLIGYTVPFPGAIIRYKIIFELMLLITISLCTKLTLYSSNSKKLHI